MIKACIFDCDGTLLDTLVSIMYSANHALTDFGFSEYGPEEYRMFVGEGAKVLIERCLKHEKKLSERQADEIFAEVFSRYRQYFSRDCMYEVKPYEGIIELLEELKKRGILLAVLSNKPHEQTIKVIEDSFGNTLFDYVSGQKEEIARKPAPDGALLLAKKMHVLPEECLYIGDTGTDMLTGNRAGMHTVGVLWGFRDQDELEAYQAQHLIRKPSEMLSLI